MTALTLNLNPIIQLTDEQFYQLCQENPDVRLEGNAEGKLIIMPPAGGETGKRNVKLIVQLALGNEPSLAKFSTHPPDYTLPKGGD